MEKHITALKKFIKDRGEENVTLYFNDQFLENVVNGRKENMESALKYLDSYIRLRFETYPQLLRDSVPIATPLYDVGHFRILKELDRNGCFVLYMSVSQWSPHSDSQTAVEDWLREFCLILDYLMLTQASVCREGVMAIFDLRDYEYKHVRLMTLPNLLKITKVQFTYPIKFKGFHVLISGFIWRTIFNMFRPFLPNKIAGRIRFHKNEEGLNDFFPEHTLPNSLGGSLTGDEAFDMNFPDKLKGLEAHFAQAAAAC